MKKRLPALALFIILSALSGCRHDSLRRPETDWSVYRKAYELLGTKPDTAFYLFNQLAVRSRDSLQIAMAYSVMGQIQYRAGDYYGSEESLLTSLKHLREEQTKHHYYIASDYNDLGLVRSELKDPQNALDFYRRSLRFDRDSSLLEQTWNNMAYEWQRTKQYQKAIALYRKLLARIKPKNTEYARTLTNLATAQWQADPDFDAGTPLRAALAVRKASGDLWGQNSSYAHLADYYRFTKPDSALFFAGAMYRIAQQLTSPDDRLEALGKLAGMSSPLLSKKYFESYRSLNDSLQTARNAAKNQFALVRYNVERERTRNLELQKENAERSLQLFRQSVLFYGSLAGFLALSAFSVGWYRKKRREQQADKERAILDTSQKASKKVHDTLANDTYRIMKTVQQGRVPDKEWLVYHINDLYIRTRDMSYELVETDQKDYHLRISELLRSFGDDFTRVLVVGNKPEFWERIGQAQKFGIRYILQELMVNMQKHSKAGNVTVKFEVTGDRCIITYFDDGIGLGKVHQPKNGLTNTGNRIKEMGGTITFGDESGNGLLITLSFAAVKLN